MTEENTESGGEAGKLPEAPAGPKRPKLHFRPVFTDRLLGKIDSIMATNECGLYQSGGGVVQVHRLDHQVVDDSVSTEDSPLIRHSGSLTISKAAPHLILVKMIGSAWWFKWDGRKEDWVLSVPPLEFAHSYNALGRWTLPVLRGIAETPFMRSNGSIVTTEGYDEASGIYLDTNGKEFPEVPRRPSRADAEASLGLLADMLKGFPFVSRVDLSVALSAFLTAPIRRSLDKAPAIGFDATTMGTGKTLLTDCVAMMVTGHRATAISMGNTEEEMNKRLFSIFLQGDPVIVMDNIGRPVASDELCTILTSPTWQNRVLGVSENREVQTNALLLLNGNAMRFKGDVSTRVIVSTMDAAMEDPTSRRFDRNLYEWVPANQGPLLTAALTVLRAYIVAGRPGDFRPTRFDQWDKTVRGALIWLGYPDPWLGNAGPRAEDSERDNHVALMTAWRESIGVNNWVTVRQIMAAVDEAPGGDPLWTEEGGALLDEALDTVFGRIGVTANALSRYLGKIDGRVLDSMRITKKKVRRPIAEYRLELLTP